MKPTVPEFGSIISLKGDKAVVLMMGGHACKGCGAAAIGLCRAADTSMQLTVTNEVGAKVGDTVRIGLDKATRARGYFLAYIIPLISLLAGAAAGHIAGSLYGVPSLDVLCGSSALGLTLLFTFRKLKELDCTAMMTISGVIPQQPVFKDEIKTDEERRYEDHSVCR
ncbi:MAG: SoxR reducing system RseC family protein [Thermodesulfovibrionales bacterium]